MKTGKNVIIALALLANLWFVSSCNNGPKREVWLDEVYKDSCFVQDWGIPQINQSVVWTPLTVNGVVYKRGSAQAHGSPTPPYRWKCRFPALAAPALRPV